MRDIVIKCEQWLSDEVKKAGASGIILGLSGGIDSSVLAALGREALGHDGVLGVIMPCHSNPNDEADAKLLAETLDVKYTRVDLSAAYDSMCEALGVEVSPLVSSNMKARLRMV
ncbi:MAG: NAD(+) synthase, partial [Synergistaceae bacterium]|nr:NAD(+) synthase [Synergistaceae bacterium]